MSRRPPSATVHRSAARGEATIRRRCPEPPATSSRTATPRAVGSIAMLGGGANAAEAATWDRRRQPPRTKRPGLPNPDADRATRHEPEQLATLPAREVRAARRADKTPTVANAGTPEAVERRTTVLEEAALSTTETADRRADCENGTPASVKRVFFFKTRSIRSLLTAWRSPAGAEGDRQVHRLVRPRPDLSTIRSHTAPRYERRPRQSQRSEAEYGQMIQRYCPVGF